MSLAGKGVVAIWHDLLPEAKDDFYEWHNREHMPERVGIPGFRRGRRYIAISGAPEFFNLYEAENETVSVRQRLYPFADRGPTSYMPGGQEWCGSHCTSRAGWFDMQPGVVGVLHAVGVTEAT